MDEKQVNTVEENEKKSFWTTVTPFSRILVLVLFIALPFAGFWVGYKYAPVEFVEVEKVVEVEVDKIVEVEKESEIDIDYSCNICNNTFTDDIKVGDVVAGMEVVSVGPYMSEQCIDGVCRKITDIVQPNIKVIFSGEKKIKGEISYSIGIISGARFWPNEPETLPQYIFQRDSTSFRLSEEIYSHFGDGEFEVIVTEVTINEYPADPLSNHIVIEIPNDNNYQ